MVTCKELETISLLHKESPGLISTVDLENLYNTGYNNGYYAKGVDLKNKRNSKLKQTIEQEVIPASITLLIVALLALIPYRWIYLANCEIYQKYDKALEECKKGNYDAYLEAYYLCSSDWFTNGSHYDRQERLTKVYNSHVPENKKIEVQ